MHSIYSVLLDSPDHKISNNFFLLFSKTELYA